MSKVCYLDRRSQVSDYCKLCDFKGGSSISSSSYSGRGIEVDSDDRIRLYDDYSIDQLMMCLFADQIHDFLHASKSIDDKSRTKYMKKSNITNLVHLFNIWGSCLGDDFNNISATSSLISQMEDMNSISANQQLAENIIQDVSNIKIEKSFIALSDYINIITKNLDNIMSPKSAFLRSHGSKFDFKQLYAIKNKIITNQDLLEKEIQLLQRDRNELEDLTISGKEYDNFRDTIINKLEGYNCTDILIDLNERSRPVLPCEFNCYINLLINYFKNNTGIAPSVKKIDTKIIIDATKTQDNSFTNILIDKNPANNLLRNASTSVIDNIYNTEMKVITILPNIFDAANTDSLVTLQKKLVDRIYLDISPKFTFNLIDNNENSLSWSLAHLPNVFQVLFNYIEFDLLNMNDQIVNKIISKNSDKKNNQKIKNIFHDNIKYFNFDYDGDIASYEYPVDLKPDRQIMEIFDKSEYLDKYEIVQDFIDSSAESGQYIKDLANIDLNLYIEGVNFFKENINQINKYKFIVNNLKKLYDEISKKYISCISQRNFNSTSRPSLIIDFLDGEIKASGEVVRGTGLFNNLSFMIVRTRKNIISAFGEIDIEIGDISYDIIQQLSSSSFEDTDDLRAKIFLPWKESLINEYKRAKETSGRSKLGKISSAIFQFFYWIDIYYILITNFKKNPRNQKYIFYTFCIQKLDDGREIISDISFDLLKIMWICLLKFLRSAKISRIFRDDPKILVNLLEHRCICYDLNYKDSIFKDEVIGVNTYINNIDKKPGVNSVNNVSTYIFHYKNTFLKTSIKTLWKPIWSVYKGDCIIKLSKNKKTNHFLMNIDKLDYTNKYINQIKNQIIDPNIVFDLIKYGFLQEVDDSSKIEYYKKIEENKLRFYPHYNEGIIWTALFNKTICDLSISSYVAYKNQKKNNNLYLFYSLDRTTSCISCLLEGMRNYTLLQKKNVIWINKEAEAMLDENNYKNKLVLQACLMV